LAQKAKLRLDTAAFIKQGGRSGAAIVPGNSAHSLLLHAVLGKDRERMPPENEGVPLTAAQVATLKAWIDAGAKAPENEPIPDDPRKHWSFQKPVRPTPPAGAHPVDAFLDAERAKHNLRPLPPTDKATLLRRVTLDLTGLPPTTAELDAFLADTTATAYATVVARLLASPQYGERWARHWMDVWRYADWHGRRMVPDVWNSAPQIWRWRDWIVQSLNKDVGYDRMVAAMLAGDEIAPTDAGSGAATGYLIRNWYALNRNDWMRANVEHVGKAFLGLTFNCAHCHDHKYDPITQEDYFRFRAFFEPISIRQDRVAGEADPGPFQEYDYSVLRKVQRVGAVRIYDRFPDAPTWFYTGGDERNRVAERGSIRAGLPRFLAPNALTIKPVDLPRDAWNPALQPALVATLRNEANAALATSEAAWQRSRTTSEADLGVLRQKLAEAEAAFTTLRAKHPDGGALGGKQSLVMDAGSGRRLVQRALSEAPALTDGVELRFALRLVKDAHWNFQLARDRAKGLTAGYVAFEKGRIRSYQPGGFTEFEVGQYAATTTRFTCILELQPSKDQALLTIETDANVLVKRVPVALNGWKPAQGICCDARPGSMVAIDDIQLRAGAKILVAFDFEEPTYRDGQDLTGHAGWIGSSFNQGSALAMVSSVVGAGPLTMAHQQVRAARLALANREREVTALARKHRAAQAQLASLEARIAAERATPGERETLARRASQVHREAVLAQAEADVWAHELSGDAKALLTAKAARDQAQAALTDPKLTGKYPPLGPVYPTQSTGRRKALAEWLTQRDHPLTARVAINHLWLRHFHAPLVASVADFGRNGALPSHPALLDWLAVEFMEHGWSMKHIHQLLVTSQAYQRASGQTVQDRREGDPENKYYWRMNVGRMEAEAVRDSLLACAGTLDLQMGGQELENSTALTTKRRSLYYSCQPEVDGKSELGALFDAPEPTDCYRRTRSVIPQQALALTNSAFVHEISRQIVARLPARTPAEFVVAAYRHVLSRPPSDAEARLCVEYLTTPGDTADQRASLIRALLNHNDFIAIR
jgi:hypothetical protein